MFRPALFAFAVVAALITVSIADAQFRGRGDFGRRDQGRGEERRGEERRGDQGRGDQGRRDEGRGEERRRDDERREPSSRSEGTKSGPTPTTSVQGFGSAEKELAKVPGFNVPLEAPGGNLQDRYDRRVLDRADRETLPRYDRNKDGYIGTDEAKDGQWDPPLADSDLDKDGRLSRFELYERYAKKMNLPPKTSVVYNAGSSAPSSSSGDASRGEADKSQVTDYAKGLLNRYDSNKSGMLEKDEWKDMKSDYHAADINKDSVITLEELTAKLAGFGSSRSGSSAPTSTTAAPVGRSSTQRSKWWSKESSRTGDKGEKDQKAYRFQTPTERLPKGLPDWFARNDTNADGQVMMSEYMTSLTESLAADFMKLDLNSDGVVTPEEALETSKGSKK